MVAASTALAIGPCDNTPLNLKNNTGHVLEVKRAAAFDDSTISGPTEGKAIQPGEAVTWVVKSIASNPDGDADGYLILLDKSTQAMHEFIYAMSSEWFSNQRCEIDTVITHGADTYTPRNEHTASMQVDLIAK